MEAKKQRKKKEESRKHEGTTGMPAAATRTSRSGAIRSSH